MSKDLKERVKAELKRRKIKIPALAAETGIPADRIYKWYQQDNNPKYEDVTILEDWLKGGTNSNLEVKEDEIKAWSETKNELVALRAAVKILTLEVANLRIRDTKDTATKSFLELEKMMQEEASRILVDKRK